MLIFWRLGWTKNEACKLKSSKQRFISPYDLSELQVLICDRKITAIVKGNVYKMVVRPAMMCGLEIVAQEVKLEVAELKILRVCIGSNHRDSLGWAVWRWN